MKPFEFYNPVKIIYGVDQIKKKVGRNVPKNATLMITYGGGSIKKNGVYDQVMESLKEHHEGRIIEFSGIEANPEYTTLLKAVEIARKEGVDFLLSVGGGSVCDGTKFISAAINYNGIPWEMVEDHTLVPKDSVPFGVVITLPATASEFNKGAVVSWRAEKKKKPLISHHLFPKFSIIDPATTLTLSFDQMATGICDAFIHVIEQYVTYPCDAKLQDRVAEGIILTLIEETDRMIKDPKDVDARGNIFWCASNALNYFLGSGTVTDWTMHSIGHLITVHTGLDHGKTLAVVLPGMWRKKRDHKRDKLVQYAERVWGITGNDPDEVAERAIVRTEEWLHDVLKMPIRFSHAGIDDVEELAEKIHDGAADFFSHGERDDITPEVVKEIVLMQK